MKNSLRILFAIVFIAALSFNTSSGTGKGYNIPVHSITIKKVDSSQTVATIQLINYDTAAGFHIDTINWEFIHDGFAFTGWNYNFCDFANCYYSPNLPSGKADLLPSRTNGIFKLTVDSFNKHALSATMLVKVWDNKDAKNPDTISITIDATRLGIENDLMAPNSLKLFPNPATDYINIESNQTGFVPERAIVYDALSKIVSEQNISGETSRLPVFDLPKGVYFIKLNDRNNRQAIKQFIKD